MAEPRSRWVRLLALALLVVAGAGQAMQLTDDRGVTVNLAQPPVRIVTLLPSLAETVCELGACDRLVGVDRYSNWPDRLRKLPHLGDVDEVQFETILALKPDLVLLSATSRAITRLQSLGVPVFGVELKTIADVRRTLARVAQLLQVAGSEQAWARIEAGIAQAARALPPALRGTTVYFEVAAGPYAASASSHVGELLTRIGAVDVVPGSLGSVPRLNPEFVVRADPQVIMLSYPSADVPAQRPGWQRIRAVRDGRVCAFAPAQADVVARPGPRLAEAAQIIVRCLRGEREAGS